mgnify:CR=1 FL=1
MRSEPWGAPKLRDYSTCCGNKARRPGLNDRADEEIRWRVGLVPATLIVVVLTLLAIGLGPMSAVTTVNKRNPVGSARTIDKPCATIVYWPRA